MDSVSDQLTSSLLTQQAYVVSMIGERDSIYRLRESVGEYDAAAGTEQPTLQEEVETLLQIIKQQVENPPCSVTGYTAEVWQATDTYGDLERIYNASHWYINSHERSILEAQQSYIDTLDRIQEDLSKERWEKGYELVMVSSASALSLVLSSGLLTTGTLTAETAALSTVAAAFVYSDYIEGVQEMYYGCVGDISSASVNPLKDTVFGGWEEGYQAAEMLSIGVASYSGMQDIARAEQAAQLEQIYAQKAEQIAYSEVDIDELSNLEWDGGQYAERIEIGGESGRYSLPQGISQEQFSNASKLLRDRVGDISNDIVVQGSRAKGTAKPTSDIDIALRVSGDKFDSLINQYFKTPNPGSAKERTMLHAIETGKIQAGEAKLSGLRKELQEIFGMEVDISIIKQGGAFDNPPFIPFE